MSSGIDPVKASRLQRAVLRQSVQHPEARRVTSERTTRDLDATRGSAAIMQAAGSGTAAKHVTSINVIRSDGTLAKPFWWGSRIFGWGSGEWPES